MGQVESSDVDGTQDTPASPYSSVTTLSGRQHPLLELPIRSPSRGRSHGSSSSSSGSSNGPPGQAVTLEEEPRSVPFHRSIINNNALSSRQRTRSGESECSSGANTSSATDLSIPAIVISECSDEAETDIEFDPAFFRTSEKRTDDQHIYQNSHFVQREGPKFVMDLEITKYQDKRPSRLKLNRKKSESNKGVKSTTERSGGSISDLSDKTSVSSKDSTKAKKVRLENEGKKKSIFGKGKGSLTNRWGSVVSEFEDSYTPSSKRVTPKKDRRVSKLSMERFDNVKQVFSRSMPLPMQTAPPGASATEIELETRAKKSSSKLSPGALPASTRNSATEGRSVQQQQKSSMAPVASGPQSKKDDRRKSRIETEKYSKEEMTQEVVMKGGGQQTGRTASNASSTVSQKNNTQSSASQASSSSKKGVKFRSKSLTIEDTAQIVVDDAIRAALELLGYKNASSYSGSSSRNKHSYNTSHRESKDSRNSITRSSISKMTSEKISIEERQRLERAKRGDSSNAQRSIEHGPYDQFISDNRSGSKEFLSYHHEKRRSSFYPRNYDNDKRRQSKMRILPGYGQKGKRIQPINSLGDLYDMTIQPHTDKPCESDAVPRSAYVTNNTMVKLYGEKEERKASVIPEVTKSQTESALKTQDPPTITRGTVTRVLHGLNNETQPPTAKQLLTQLRTEEAHDYSTWPLAKSEKFEANINTAEIRDDVTCHSLPEAESLTLSFEHGELMKRAASTGNLTLIGEMPRHYELRPSPSSSRFHDEFIVTRRAQSADNLLDMPSYQDTHGPIRLQSGVSAPIYFMGPQGNLIPVYQGGWNPEQYVYPEPEQAGAYSNEPIIVADLLDKPEPSLPSFPSGGSALVHSHRSFSEPAINMNKHQSLNLYLFNHAEPKGTKSLDVSYESQPYDYDYYSYQNHDDIPEEYEEYDEYECDSTEMREYTQFHKQTQTLPPPKPKKRPPVVRKIERREQPRPIPMPIYVPKPKHRETTHYITKERQIERLPPPPLPRSSFATQTEARARSMGNLATQTDPPKTRKPKVDRMEVTRTFNKPTVSQIREVIGCSESRAPKPVPTTARDIKVDMKPSYFDMNEIIERENRSREMVRVDNQVAPPDDDDESEEEMHELIEVEEKEQRVAMSIFEEFEFHFQRKEDGKTTDKQSGRASDLVPWLFPDKYEAVVDHRKQKSTQVREVDRTGAHSYHAVPPLVDGSKPQQKTIVHDSAGHRFNTSIQNGSQPTNAPIFHSQSGQPLRQNEYQDGNEYSDPNNAKLSAKDTITQHTTATWGVPGKSPPGYAAAHSQALRQEFVQRERNTVDPKPPSASPSYGLDNLLGKGSKTSMDQDNEQSDGESKSKSKFISRFDPDNIFFQVPEWKSMDSNDTMYHMSHDKPKEQQSNNQHFDTQHQQYNQNPQNQYQPYNQKFHNHQQQYNYQYSQPSKNATRQWELNSNEHTTNSDNLMQMSSSMDGTPQLNTTRYVKDEDGNLIKITEFEKKTSETVEYEDEGPPPSIQPQWGMEQLPAADYLDVNLLSQPVVETVEYVEEDPQEDEENDLDQSRYDGPEVISETSKHYVPVEYSEQTRTLGINEPDDVELQLKLREYETKEKTMGISDDGQPAHHTEQYLYDARTATLRPMVTREGSKRLMQYSIGDTMITEL